MSMRFQELAWRSTPKGAISLRRRSDPLLGQDVYEVKLDDEYLMSSAFIEGEIALAQLALAALPDDDLDVVVGGLGLGYTAHAVLQDPRVRSLLTIDALGEVIDWHRRHLVPQAVHLTGDPRCRLLEGDFFELAATCQLDPSHPRRRFHAIVVDIDHSPAHLLHPSHATFYEPDGLRRLARNLHPGGVFALWSNDSPDATFITTLSGALGDTEAHTVVFANPYQEQAATNTIYLARRPT